MNPRGGGKDLMHRYIRWVKLYFLKHLYIPERIESQHPVGRWMVGCPCVRDEETKWHLRVTVWHWLDRNPGLLVPFSPTSPSSGPGPQLWGPCWLMAGVPSTRWVLRVQNRAHCLWRPFPWESGNDARETKHQSTNALSYFVYLPTNTSTDTRS